MNNWKFFLVISLGVILVYFGMDFFKPVVNDNTEIKRKIDSLNNELNKIELYQQKLDSTINFFNEQINNVDSNIKNIKGQKTIVREIYYEKINNVNSYDARQVDSFFTDRYPGIY